MPISARGSEQLVMTRVKTGVTPPDPSFVGYKLAQPIEKYFNSTGKNLKYLLWKNYFPVMNIKLII